MLCQNCGKKPATMHLTVWDGKNKTEQYLCEECAAAQGHFKLAPEMAMNAIFPDFFSDFFNDAPKWVREPENQKICPTCGLSFSALCKDGRPGCPDCYEFFADAIDPLLLRVHGADVHSGKTPSGYEKTAPAENKSEEKEGGFLEKIRKAKAAKAQGLEENKEAESPLARLQKEIINAIKEERFEDAARLRDEIKALEAAQENKKEEKEDPADE